MIDPPGAQDLGHGAGFTDVGNVQSVGFHGVSMTFAQVVENENLDGLPVKMAKTGAADIAGATG